MADKNDDSAPQKPPRTSAEREARLARALRENLRRRKAPPPAKPSAADSD